MEADRPPPRAATAGTQPARVARLLYGSGRESRASFGRVSTQGSSTTRRRRRMTNYYGPGGSQYPNLEAFPVKWKPLKKLLDENARLHRQEQEAGLAWEQAKNKLKALVDEQHEVRVRALRTGEDLPDGDAIKDTEQYITYLEQHSRDLRQARALVADDIHRCVIENAEAWMPAVDEQLDQKIADLAQRAADMLAVVDEVAAFARLKEWLDKPEAGFGISPMPGSEGLIT